MAFEKLWQRTRQTPDSRDRLKLFLEIINLYRGEFLEEFELEEWGRQQRHRYETLFLQVVELAARQLLAEGRSQEALEVLKKGLAVNYYRERLHRYTLQAYEQLGLDEDKTIHCQKAVQIFSEAFDFEPDFIKARPGEGGRNGDSV